MAETYNYGQRVVLFSDWEDDDGVPTNPTTVTLEVMGPDDVVILPAISTPSVGRSEAAVVLDQTGLWSWHWVATGNGVEAAPSGQFLVGASPFAGGDSYDDEPGSNNLDALRLLLGDVDPLNPLFSPAQLEWLVARHPGDLNAAAVLGARLLRAQAAQLVDVAEGDVRRSLSQRAKGLQALVEDLTTQAVTEAAAVAAIPLAGGLTYSERDTRDPDLVRPYFTTREFPAWDDDLLRRLV